MRMEKKTDRSGKQNIIYNYYKQTFKLETKETNLQNLNVINNNVTDNENKALIENIKISEIKNAISELKDGKSPGIDGFPIEFYKQFWED